MAKVAEAAAETVAEVAEEVAEHADVVAEVSRSLQPREMRLLLMGLGGGLVGGFVVGGMVINRRLRLEYEKLAEQEIDEMREHFRKRLVAREEKPELATEATKIVEREGYSSPQTPVIEEVQDGGKAGGGAHPTEEGVEETVVVEEEVEVVAEVEAPEAEVSNVFEQEWDYEEEVRLRRPDRPYVIHVDERHENDGFTEMSLVYYAGDDVLADERDTPVEDKEKVIGEGNLDKFGHGSGDPSIVFVRNDVLKIEVEIVKNDGSYAEVVHGFQHSEPDRRRRRGFDDEPGSP